MVKSMFIKNYNYLSRILVAFVFCFLFRINQLKHYNQYTIFQQSKLFDNN